MIYARLVQLSVGLPQTRGEAGAPASADRPWTSAIFKESVAHPLWLGRTNLEGDRQADLKVHGGPDKAVLAYAALHYRAWQAEFPEANLAYGAFGENFTIDGLDETTVALGDTFLIGEAVVQVSEPRQPCWKLGRRCGLPELPKRVLETGRGGWYLRVLQEGRVAPGNILRLIDRPAEAWTIARINRLIHGEKDEAAARFLAGTPLLGDAVRKVFAKQLSTSPSV